MTVMIFGGCGFVGLNIAEALLREGAAVALVDRNPLPDAAALAFAALPGRLEVLACDVTQPEQVAAVLRPGVRQVVLGAALTAGPAREAADPEGILAVNLLGPVNILRQARAAGVARVLNLSSGSACGPVAGEDGLLREAGRTEPESLYAVSKRASEQVLARLAGLWEQDVLSVRLSAVFGPWERATGARDTLSPQCQLLQAAARGEPALLPREGRRDWIYAPDVAAAVLVLLRAPQLRHRLYNITQPEAWTVLRWGAEVARHWPGLACRLAAPGEAPSVSLHGNQDRPNLDPARLADEFGWHAKWGMAASAEHLAGWWRAQAG